MPRLFTALEIPEEVADPLGRLRQPMPGAKWIEPANFHVTLRFAGDIDNGLAREFAANLAEIDASAFELDLAGVGVFGGNEPRAIWAGVVPSPELDALARAHERAARNAGLPPETRKFKPHVTLARLRQPEPTVIARWLQRHGAFRAPAFFVSRFVLYSSKPLSGGGPYVVEQGFPLYGGVDPALADHDY